jgi:hypothetical protein
MKNKNNQFHTDALDMRLVKKDFTFVVILNLVLLAAMFALYFWNRSTGALDHFFSGIIKF